MTYLVSLSFGIANCISATRASKQIYDELVRDPMRAIPDPFKKLSEKNFLCQPPPPHFFHASAAADKETLQRNNTGVQEEGKLHSS